MLSKQDRNVLMVRWGSVLCDDMTKAFEESDFAVEDIQWIGEDYENNPMFAKELQMKLCDKSYEMVFSFNYFPIVSDVCEDCGIKYVSWIYDCPHLTMYSKTIFNVNNYIFHFDSSVVEEFKTYGIKKIYYLPLAVNVERLNRIEIDRKKVRNISFVGSLYEDNMYNQIIYLPEYLKGYLEGIMETQSRIYGINMLPELISNEMMDELKKYVKFDLGENFFIDDKILFCSMFLEKNVTYKERRKILKRLSMCYDVDLYTYNQELQIGNVRNCGYADYKKQMPHIFKNSKININISLKSIRSGIPLRVFDVLGVGGFLITNYQSDLLQFFEPGRDLVVYEDEEDLLWKIKYYLKHEKERKEIAANGYEKVCAEHQYNKKVEFIIKILESVDEARE